jgi:hypothetical protein
LKTYKNPDENPGLPVDFKNLDGKSKGSDFCQMLQLSKRNLGLWYRNPQDSPRIEKPSVNLKAS